MSKCSTLSLIYYSPCSYALGHLLDSAPEAPSVVPEENVPRNCLDLGCGGGGMLIISVCDGE